MFAVVGSEILGDESLAHGAPVLLALLRQEDRECLGRALEQAAHRHKDAVRFWVAAEQDLPVLQQRLRAPGTPSFLLFLHGREVGRLLGKTDGPELIRFLGDNLSLH